MILAKHRPVLRHRKKVRPFDKLRANGSCSLHGVPNTALKRRFEPTLEGALGRRADLGLGDRTIFEQDHRRDAAHAIFGGGVGRSEERRVGKECVSTCRSWWSPVP